ncbi:MAG TPA: hypothetical protein DCY31_00845, partial [Ruminococcaceae bacterium]|nr:hypothetical protein [Oscillospiraceae bacterium]
MKDENGREYSDYDIDKLIEEYSKINRNDEPPVSQPPKERKKFVVHIDESLIDTPQDDEPKPQSGGIYFSNYQKHHSASHKDGSDEAAVPEHKEKKKSTVKHGKLTRDQRIERVKNDIEKVGGKAAVGFMAFILISTIILSYIGITCVGDMLAVNRSDENKPVDIPADASYSEIIDILKDNGLIKRKLFCKMFTKFRGFDDETYLSGQYYLNSKMGVEGMLKDIMAAPVTAESISLSFPEGWTATQIVEKLEKYDVCNSAKILTAMRTGKYDYDFLNEIEDNSKRYLKMEGYLFPDTYDFYRNSTPREVLEKLKARGAEIVSATCPNVRHIQRLVTEAEAAGRQVVIIGEHDHPEVQGIASWCRDAKIFGNAEEVAKWAEETAEIADLPITMVAQTTCIRALWESCVKFLKKECTNLKIDDTICNATQKRQSEAAEIASSADVMVVVGDRKSANTRPLTEICKESCTRVYQIEDADELSPDMFHGCTVAGLTAGASTPAGIIKEVYATMTEEIKTIEGNETFEEMLDKSFKTLNTGDKVVGTVTGIGNTEVQVDLGTKHAGYIPYDEVSNDPSVKPEDVLKVGDEIEVFVVRVNDQEGTVQLSKKKLDGLKVWDDMAAWVEDKTTVEGVITEENKGGLVANVKGIRVFIPASQSGIAKGGDMAGMVGKTVQMKITEVNRA